MIKFNKSVCICDGCDTEVDAINDLNPHQHYHVAGTTIGQQIDNFTSPHNWLKIRNKHFCPNCILKIEKAAETLANDKQKININI